ncbi:MAG: ABC transporter transmembrane domain-containing protein [Lapillicoccus sp.]
MLAGLALILPGVLLPTFTRVFVDDVLVGGITDWLSPLLTAMGTTLFFLLALTWLQQSVLLRLGLKLEVAASGRFLWHMLHLPVTFFDLRYAADIASRTQLNARIATLLSSRLAGNVVNLTMIVFYRVVINAGPRWRRAGRSSSTISSGRDSAPRRSGPLSWPTPVTPRRPKARREASGPRRPCWVGAPPAGTSGGFNHVKITCAPGLPLDAKVYVSAAHAWRLASRLESPRERPEPMSSARG